MNILILGGVGFLGSNLVRRCLKDNKNKIVVVDSLDPLLNSSLKNFKGVISKIDFIKGDIRDYKLMTKVVKKKDVIFNCAAQTSHPLSLKNPLLDAQINCLGNLTLLEAVKNYNKKAFIVYASSSTVIGRAVKKVIDETHPELPLDIYSANKGVAEKYYYIYNKVYDLKTLSFRFPNLYGPYGKNSADFGFVNYFIYLALKNKTIKIYGDGKQKRNLMYIEDAVDLLYKSIKYKKLIGNVYFAVHPKHYSVLEIAKLIVKVYGTGMVKKIKWPDVRKRIEIGNVIISGKRLYTDIKWKPKFSLKPGLEKTKTIIEKKKLLD